MKVMRLFNLFFLVITMAIAPYTIVGALASSISKSGCTDFLAALHIKPPHVLFIKCEPIESRQGKPLSAIYRVPGIHAATVEDFLVRTAQMPHLKKSCCQWDGPPGQFTGKDGKIYTIYMMSPETNVGHREQWSNIVNFEIVVETLTEDI